MRTIPFVTAALLASAVAWAQAPATSGVTPASGVGAGASPSVRTSSAQEIGILKRVAMIDMPGEPGFPAVALDRGRLVLAHSANDVVEVFDISKRRIVAEIKEMKGASGLAIDPAAGKLYVANADAAEIAVVSTQDWSIERRIPLKASPRSLLLVPQWNRLYSTNWQDRSFSVVDLKQGSARTVAVEGAPAGMTFDPDNRRIYASLQDTRQIAVLTPELEPVKLFPLEASMPSGVAFDSEQQRLYVAVRYAVISLDPETGQEVGRAAVPAGVTSLNVQSGRLYAAASGGVVLIYRITGSGLLQENEVTSEVKGHVLAFDPQTGMILMPGGLDGRSKLVLLRYIAPGPPVLVSR